MYIFVIGRKIVLGKIVTSLKTFDLPTEVFLPKNGLSIITLINVELNRGAYYQTRWSLKAWVGII